VNSAILGRGTLPARRSLGWIAKRVKREGRAGLQIREQPISNNFCVFFFRRIPERGSVSPPTSRLGKLDFRRVGDRFGL